MALIFNLHGIAVFGPSSAARSSACLPVVKEALTEAPGIVDSDRAIRENCLRVQGPKKTGPNPKRLGTRSPIVKVGGFMAILALCTGEGITKQMYEALRPEVKWETNHPDGVLLHSCAFDDRGNIHVADVWESQEALDAFMNNRLLPAMKKLGVPAPKVSVYQALNVNFFPAAQKHLLKDVRAQKEAGAQKEARAQK